MANFIKIQDKDGYFVLLNLDNVLYAVDDKGNTLVFLVGDSYDCPKRISIGKTLDEFSSLISK